MDIHFVIRRAEPRIARKPAVLRAVDALSKMLYPRPDGERFCLHRQRVLIKHLEGLASAVTDREYDAVRFDDLFLAVTLRDRSGDAPVSGVKTGQLGFKKHLSAQGDNLLTQIFDRDFQLVRADMRLGVVKYLLRRAVEDEFLHHLALAAVLGACVQLAV